jgi:hypothetical protein
VRFSILNPAFAFYRIWKRGRTTPQKSICGDVIDVDLSRRCGCADRYFGRAVVWLLFRFQSQRQPCHTLAKPENRDREQANRQRQRTCYKITHRFTAKFSAPQDYR